MSIKQVLKLVLYVIISAVYVQTAKNLRFEIRQILKLTHTLQFAFAVKKLKMNHIIKAHFDNNLKCPVAISTDDGMEKRIDAGKRNPTVE